MSNRKRTDGCDTAITKVGLGRPVNHGWTEAFYERFERLRPANSLWTRRIMPGVTYLSNQDMENLPDEDRDRYKRDGLIVVEEMVADLYERAVLNDAVGKQPLYPAFAGLEVLPIKAGGIRLLANIVDIESDAYNTGYVIVGEKLNATTEYPFNGLPPITVRTDEVSTHKIALGIARGSANWLSPRFLHKLGKQLESVVMLEPIGPINFESSQHTS
jgi:hypothetical protein